MPRKDLRFYWEEAWGPIIVKASEGNQLPAINTPRRCQFCYVNGERREVVLSHSLKAPDGTVTCPVLQSYTCPICGATGRFAHTRKYCEKNKSRFSIVKRERRNAAGDYALSYN